MLNCVALQAVAPSGRYDRGRSYRQLRSLRSLAGGYDCVALRADDAAGGTPGGTSEAAGGTPGGTSEAAGGTPGGTSKTAGGTPADRLCRIMQSLAKSSMCLARQRVFSSGGAISFQPSMRPFAELKLTPINRMGSPQDWNFS